ncbi:helix-turn-helix domain-containing protein [Mucilaginibacter calamicampi]|uniref:Helix-turn-helix domain-containing protein n=1 Tax=Mucilaginibacter calamicampi TaxID=1302352 RepID=A0ABW2Z313_9SPHI
MSLTLHVIENIRKYRESRRYTQEYMGYTLGVGQNAYSKLELGKTKLTLEQLFSISYTLNVEPALLMRKTDKKLPKRRYKTQNDQM